MQSVCYRRSIVFVVVVGVVFRAGSLLDERNARARLLRERLAAVQKAAEREPSEELALLRDEMLSEIPALDNLLRRSERVSNLQILLSQAGLEMRAGNMLLICLASGASFGESLPLSLAEQMFFWLGGFFLGALLPYSYASYRRQPALPEIRGTVSGGHRHACPRGARRSRFHHGASK